MSTTTEPMEKYLAAEAISAGKIVTGMRSMAHLRLELDSPDVETDAFKFGTAAHAAVLESDAFEERYAVSEPCQAEMKSGKRKGEPCGLPGKYLVAGSWRCGKHAGDGTDVAGSAAIIITPQDYADCVGIMESVHAHPVAVDLMSRALEREQSLYWTDPNTNLKCKCRPDISGDGIHINLKTTTATAGPGPTGFAREVFRYNYHVGMAHYDDGFLACGYDPPRSFLLAVEKQPPYAVCVHEITRDLLTVGRTIVRSVMAEIAEAYLSDHWPAYPERIHQLDVRAWMEGEL